MRVVFDEGAELGDVSFLARNDFPEDLLPRSFPRRQIRHQVRADHLGPSSRSVNLGRVSISFFCRVRLRHGVRPRGVPAARISHLRQLRRRHGRDITSTAVVVVRVVVGTADRSFGGSCRRAVDREERRIVFSAVPLDEHFPWLFRYCLLLGRSSLDWADGLFQFHSTRARTSSWISRRLCLSARASFLDRAAFQRRRQS